MMVGWFRLYVSKLATHWHQGVQCLCVCVWVRLMLCIDSVGISRAIREKKSKTRILSSVNLSTAGLPAVHYLHWGEPGHY